MQKRKKYTQEYKREAVALARSAGVPVSQVARELGLNANVLTRWCREAADAQVPAFPGQGKPRDEELAALKRELTGLNGNGIFYEKRQRSSRRNRSEV